MIEPVTTNEPVVNKEPVTSTQLPDVICNIEFPDATTELAFTKVELTVNVFDIFNEPVLPGLLKIRLIGQFLQIYHNLLFVLMMIQLLPILMMQYMLQCYLFPLL